MSYLHNGNAMRDDEKLTSRMTILLPPSAHFELRRVALVRETDVSTLVRAAILKDGKLKI